MILVVEDDDDVREMLQLTLESHGFVVDLADNGSAAIDALERQRPCLVILDLVMPVMTGWQVLDEMKVRNLGDVPVCVISALGGKAPAAAVAMLSKPFATSDLLAIADRFCARGGVDPHARG